jgi:hypothetical protein
MKKLSIIIAIVAFTFSTNAQTALDALTFSKEQPGGSARYMAMGGAFNALGADISTLSVNPAGIGVYRSNEFSFTPTLEFIGSTTKIDNPDGMGDAQFPTTSDSKVNFNFNSLGYVATTKTGKTRGIISYNIGVGYNRLQNYHKSYQMGAQQTSHSMTDDWNKALSDDNNWITDSNNDPSPLLAPYGAFLSWESYLMTDEYYDDNGELKLIDGSPLSPLLGHETEILPDDATTVDLLKDVIERGSIDEWFFTVGGNFDYKVYFGATLGLQDISQSKSFFISESFNNNSYGESYFRQNPITGNGDIFSSNNNGFNYLTESNTEGFGINLKLGIIVKPTDELRLSFAVHTPTYKWMNVEFIGNMINDTEYYDTNGDAQNYGEAELASDDFSSRYNYRVLSPYKLHVGAAYTFLKKIAVDIEGDMIDYSMIKMFDNDGRTSSYTATNEDMDNMYDVAFNARGGVEIRLNNYFSLRGGYAFYGSPYKRSKDNISDYVGNTHNISGGLGFRNRDFFVDLAYVNSRTDGDTYVYDDAIEEDYENSSKASLDLSTNKFMLSFGFKF